MPRFSILAVMVATGVIATYLAAMFSATHGNPWGAIFAMLIYAAIAAYWWFNERRTKD